MKISLIIIKYQNIDCGRQFEFQ